MKKATMGGGNKVLEEEEEAGNRNRSRVLGTRTPLKTSPVRELANTKEGKGMNG